MEPEEVLDYIEENVSLGQQVTITTNRTEATGEVERLDPLTLNPTSGVVVEYQLGPSGQIIEVYWDDSPNSDPAETQERTLGLVDGIQVKNEP